MAQMETGAALPRRPCCGPPWACRTG